MEISNPNTNSHNVCDGFQCFKEAKYTVTEKVNNNCIIFQLCESCVNHHWVNSTNGSVKRKKKELEQQVGRPACSNTPDRNQPIQQHMVLSNG
jgi:hypothetical protein